jgi:hypothetical protein
LDKQSIQQLDQQVLGEGNELIQLSTRSAFQTACERMSAQSRYQIDIFSYDLDAALYDKAEFIRSVKRLCLNSRVLAVRILLQNNLKIQQEGHRLLELAQKLTSMISIHKTHPDHKDHLENYLVVDKTGYIFRNRHQDYDGVTEFNNRLFCKKLSEQFNLAWDRSEEDSTLRRLYL